LPQLGSQQHGDVGAGISQERQRTQDFSFAVLSSQSMGESKNCSLPDFSQIANREVTLNNKNCGAVTPPFVVDGRCLEGWEKTLRSRLPMRGETGSLVTLLCRLKGIDGHCLMSVV
jgi:hypothetical protein